MWRSRRWPIAKAKEEAAAIFQKSLYLFFSHNLPLSKKTSYSICKINLNDLQEDAKPRSLSPLLELEGNDVYPMEMGCALLDSKLYILGGEVQNFKRHRRPISDRQIFPRHVYQVDTTKSKLSIHKMDIELNTGKPAPCVFAAAGKIYVLGSKFCPNIRFFDLRPFLSTIKLFECFDPNTNRWHVLDNPPVDEFIRWGGCNVFEHHRQVLVEGEEVYTGTNVLLLYNLKDGKWTRYDPTHGFRAFMRYMALNSHEAGTSSHYLYGLYNTTPVKLNLDIIPHDSYIPSSGCVYKNMVPLSSVDKSIDVDIFSETHYLHLPKLLLRYLGDHHFCHINSGMLPDLHAPYPPYSDGYTDFDVRSRGITITLFKEISHDDDNIDGNSTSKSGGEQLPHSFQAKILHSQQYLNKSRSHNVARLVNCFVVSPEPNAVAPLKASPTTKLAKVVESDDHRDKRRSDYEKPKKMEWLKKEPRADAPVKKASPTSKLVHEVSDRS